MIATSNSEYMKGVYRQVQRELKGYYYNQVVGYLNYANNNPKVKGALNELWMNASDFALDVTGAKDQALKVIVKNPGKYANALTWVHTAVCLVADNAFHGDKLYTLL